MAFDPDLTKATTMAIQEWSISLPPGGKMKMLSEAHLHTVVGLRRAG